MQALIIVDFQNDFLPSGSLPVPEGDTILPVINKLIDKFPLVVATQDWHPQDHGSFASNHPGKQIGDTVILGGISQILWPDHCVQNTKGAEFVSGLHTEKIAEIFRSGTDKHVDSYSGFLDNAKKHSTGLDQYLKERGVDEVFIVGLATDYCVKFTALDAIDLGFKAFLIKDASKGVNLQAGDVDKSLEEMQTKGVSIITSKDIL